MSGILLFVTGNVVREIVKKQPQLKVTFCPEFTFIEF